MKLSIKNAFRYVSAGFLFLLLAGTLYYTNSGSNTLKEPWDGLLSVVVPIVLIRVITIVVPSAIIRRGTRGDYVDMLLILAIVVTNMYLTRSYWYTMSAFWSFMLSVVLPAALMSIILYIAYKRNKKTATQ